MANTKRKNGRAVKVSREAERASAEARGRARLTFNDAPPYIHSKLTSLEAERSPKSPKNAWRYISQRYGPGRLAEAFKEAQSKYPAFFGSWTLAGDRLVYDAAKGPLHEAWAGLASVNLSDQAPKSVSIRMLPESDRLRRAIGAVLELSDGDVSARAYRALYDTLPEADRRLVDALVLRQVERETGRAAPRSVALAEAYRAAALSAIVAAHDYRTDAVGGSGGRATVAESASAPDGEVPGERAGRA